MKKTVGTTVRGIVTPIVRAGDDLANLVVDSLLEASQAEGFTIRDRDILGITESLLARAQCNYAPVSAIGDDISEKFDDSIGLVFPILSRNRFATILKGIADTKKKIYLLLSYPADEVGNTLMDSKKMYDLKVNPYADSFTEEDFRDKFGYDYKHPFTGIDYIDIYKKIGNGNIEIILSNDPREILKYTKDVLVCNVHNRERTKSQLKEAGAEKVYGLEDILSRENDKHGYNQEYGLLGSNLSRKDELKLFPRDSQIFVEEVQKILLDKTGKLVEVLVYGDGAFKDPVGKIWELADPIVSPGYTQGLEGRPNELKLKYIVDTELDNLSQEDVLRLLKERIRSKTKEDTVHCIEEADSLGTTPRRLVDLVGSLCDLTSGSGDKGTPVVHISGYFDNFASE